MPRTHRLNDVNSAGGRVITTSQGTVYANDLLISTDGSSVSPDAACDDNIHCAPSTANGGPTVFAENKPVNKEGDADNCGHKRTNGSNVPGNVYPENTYNVYNDAWVGGGLLYDNSAPYPAFDTGPEDFTTQTDTYVQEHIDVPEDPVPPPPPASVGLDSVQYDVKPSETVEEDPTEPPPNVPPSQDCSTIDTLPANFNWSTEPGATTFAAFAASFALSPNFTLYDLTMGPAATSASQHQFSTSVTQPAGLTQKQIMKNLCFLAKTALEPIRSQYGDMTITSGWRSASGGSQHNKGQAADFQVFSFHGTGVTGQQYYDRAKSIRDNIDYDQLILEWFGRNPWIHVSTNSSGHRKSVLTQTGRSSYTSGLKRLG